MDCSILRAGVLVLVFRRNLLVASKLSSSSCSDRREVSSSNSLLFGKSKAPLGSLCLVLRRGRWFWRVDVEMGLRGWRTGEEVLDVVVCGVWDGAVVFVCCRFCVLDEGMDCADALRVLVRFDLVGGGLLL